MAPEVGGTLVGPKYSLASGRCILIFAFKGIIDVLALGEGGNSIVDRGPGRAGGRAHGSSALRCKCSCQSPWCAGSRNEAGGTPGTVPTYKPPTNITQFFILGSHRCRFKLIADERLEVRLECADYLLDSLLPTHLPLGQDAPSLSLPGVVGIGRKVAIQGSVPSLPNSESLILVAHLGLLEAD